jgi:hypothetical protein
VNCGVEWRSFSREAAAALAASDAFEAEADALTRLIGACLVE